MEIVSLHPVDDEIVRTYLDTVEAGVLDRAASGSTRAANQVTFGLAEQLTQQSPSFASRPFGLSFWEAQVDRSMGMVMRPPSRLFIAAGMDRRIAATMPIRLEAQAGTMGGAWIPARLIGEALDGFDAHLERSAKRLLDAEIDPILAIELMRASLTHAHERRLGLFEAQDVIVPGVTVSGQTVIGPDLARLPADVLARIEAVIVPPKKPGLLDRLFRRTDSPTPEPTNGHFSDVTIVERHEQ